MLDSEKEFVSILYGTVLLELADKTQMGALNFGRGAIKKCELIPAFLHGIGKNILCRLTILSEAVLLDGEIFELKMREGVRRWSVQYTAPVRHPAIFSILSPWQPCIEI